MAAILSDSQLMAQVKAAGWTGNDALIAFAVAKAESGANSQIVSKPNNDGSVDRGLFQINSKAWSQFSAWNDPSQNASFAHDVVFKQQGWQAWSVYNSGAYKQYLNDAAKAFGAPAGSAVVSANPGATSTADTSGGSTNHFSGIMSKSLWVRIGIGGVGVLMIWGGYYLFAGKGLTKIGKVV